MQIEFEKFDAAVVPLSGSNLIEASAGTGKTYSIALMVLRLILEKQVSIREILMVTFTKAAVAELEERIRLFIRLAYRASNGEKINDQQITAMVEEAMRRSPDTSKILYAAVLLLDETSVMTIHSFCQQTLSEFAFETKQIFGADTIDDTGALIDSEINRFWRKEITGLPVPLLQVLLEHGLSRDGIKCIVKEHINGKKYLGYDEDVEYSNCEADHDKWMEALDVIRNKEEALRKQLIANVQSQLPALEAKTQSNRYASKNFKDSFISAEAFVDKLNSLRTGSKPPKYLWLLYEDIIDECGNCDALIEEIEMEVAKILQHLYCVAIRHVTNGIEQHKIDKNLLSFDDMIVRLHESLVRRNNEELKLALQKKYKAVFVDEFQDTDRLQYEIFREAFGTSTILFFIGDPKQSIYAWRKADIYTYFLARKSVDRRYSMNVNYRSSAPMIAAMNLFFSIDDPFHFGPDDSRDDRFDYQVVDAPAGSAKGVMTIDNEALVPFTYFEVARKSDIPGAVASQVAELFTANYRLPSGTEGTRNIVPSDIGILVRSNYEARNVRDALGRYGIPAVTIGDEKVLQSAEAMYVLYVMQAMDDASPENINRALLSPFTGFDKEDILNLDHDLAIEAFRSYKVTWEEDGVYTALMNFVADFNVRKTLLGRNTEGGERIITNLFQLIELVHKIQTHRVLSPLELISWLKRGIDGMETEGDEYEQRVESDEEAVKIVTIHKSKGLEYNIVIAPYLDMQDDRKNSTVCTFRDPNTNDYVSGERDSLTDEQIRWMREQNEQENRRLIYVAITRAVYKCFVFKNSSSKSNQSSLLPFMANVTGDPELIEERQVPEERTGYRYIGASGISVEPQVRAVNFTLHENNWRRISYSGLSPRHETTLKPRRGGYSDEYDQFVFNALAFGSNTGNMLHYIFENVHFGDAARWQYVIDDAVRQYAPAHKERYASMLKSLLHHVMNVQLNVDESSFKLSDISIHRRIHELEFDFKLGAFDVRSITELADANTMIAVKPLGEMQGMMNGKIDLFFEHQGKYFVLDWKSNFLGDSLEDYTGDRLTESMNENNYHLQYLVYTLAVKKYLESRLGSGFDFERDFGGVFYLFLRGVREGSQSGVFMRRPTATQVSRLEALLN